MIHKALFCIRQRTQSVCHSLRPFSIRLRTMNVFVSNHFQVDDKHVEQYLHRKQLEFKVSFDSTTLEGEKEID